MAAGGVVLDAATTSESGTSYSTWPRRYGAWRKSTARHSPARWRRRTPHSSSFSRGAVDEGAMSLQTSLERTRSDRGPAGTRRRPSLSPRSSRRRKATAGAALPHVEEYRHVTRNRPYFRAQNLTDAVRVACASGDLALAEGLPGQSRNRRRAGPARRRLPPVRRSPRLKKTSRPRRRRSPKPPTAGRHSAASSSRRSPFAARETKMLRTRFSKDSECRRRPLRRQRERRSSSPAAATALAATRPAERGALPDRRA